MHGTRFDIQTYLYKYSYMSSELERLGWLIKCIQHSHHRTLDAKLAPLDISLVQWNALREIDRNPGCSQHQLAERTFNSDQSFGTLVRRLLARGLVEQRPGFGRATIHRLTPKGQTMLRAGQKIMSEVVAESFAPLEVSEREKLSRLLEKVFAVRAS